MAKDCDNNKGMDAAGMSVSTRKRILTTVLTTAGVFAVGLCFGVWGPALLDFQHLVNTSQEKISLIFTARSVGSFIVMVTVSPLYDRLNSFFLNLLFFVCTIAAMLVTPWSLNLLMLAAVSAVLGGSLGTVFGGANTVVIRLWKEKTGPVLQAMFLFFICGSMISPQLVRPFLSQVVMESQNQIPERTNQTSTTSSLEPWNVTDAQYARGKTYSTEDLYKFNNVTSESSQSNIYIPFTVIAGYVFCLFILSFLAFASERFQVRLPSTPPMIPRERPKGDKLHIFFIIIIFTLMVFLYVGLDYAYASLIFLFTVKYLAWTKAEGTVLVTVFYCAQVAGRAFAIPIAKFVKPQWFVLSNIVTALTASVIGKLLVDSHVAVIWVVSVIYGSSITAFYPAMVQWLNTIVPVTGFITGLITAGIPLGYMVFPALTGYLFTSFHAVWFWDMQILGLTISLALFITAYVMMRLNQNRRKKFTKNPSLENMECMNGDAEMAPSLKS